MEIVEQKNGNHRAGAEEHRSQPGARGVHPHAAEGSRQPAAADASRGRGAIDNDQRQSKMPQVEMKGLVEEIRQPEEEEPPDRISEKFGQRKGPGLAIVQQFGPGRRAAHLLCRILIDVAQLGVGQGGVIGGLAIFAEPQQNPECAEGSGGEECRVPSVANRHPGHDERSQDGAQVGA